MGIALTRTTNEDLPLVLALEADPDVSPWITSWPLERHERAMRDSSEEHLTFRDDAGDFAGFSLLAGIGDADSSIELRRVVLARRGHGNGIEALALVLGHAFLSAGADRVWLDLVPDNSRARRVYERAGFLPDGRTGSATHLLPDGSLTFLNVMSISALGWQRAGRPSGVS